MMHRRMRFIDYGPIGLAFLLLACAPQEMDAVGSAAQQQALTVMKGELKRIEHDIDVELYIVSTIDGARHAVRLTIDAEDEDGFRDKLNILGFQVASDFSFYDYDWTWDEAVETHNVQFHNPELTFRTSAPDRKEVSAYKVLSASGDIDYYLYFYNREPEKLFRPGCRQLIELLGIQEEQIHEADPRELLSFYYGYDIDVIDIVCGDGQDVHLTFSDWCNATGLDPSVSRTRDVMIELANQTSCDEAQVALEQMTALDLRGRHLEDLRPLASIDTENIRRIDLSDNEALTHLEALQKYEYLEELKLNNNRLDNSQVESILLKEQNPTMFLLSKLELSNNLLTNIDFLRDYMTLSELDVSHNMLEDVIESCTDGGPYALGPLIALSAMTELDFSYNRISCLEPLTNILGLRTVKARENRIVSVEPLRDLAFLRHIDLANDAWQGEERAQGNIVEDLRPIPATVEQLEAGNVPMRYMRSFRDWCDHKDKFSDDGSDGRRETILAIEEAVGVSPLDDTYCDRVETALSTMTRISLYDKKISNIAPLSALTSLKRLQLGDNQIAEVRALDALSKLNWLDVSQNVLTNIDGIEGLSNLRYLDLAQNTLSEVDTNFCDFESLRHLNLANSGIVLSKAAFSGENCAIKDTLEWLDLSGTAVGDASSTLAELGRLKRLYLRSSSIVSSDQTEFLSEGKLIGLEHLDLSDNPFGESGLTLFHFSGLKALTSLFLRNCGITNVDPISNKPGKLTQLQQLDLFGNRVPSNNIAYNFDTLRYLDVRAQEPLITECPLTQMQTGCYVDPEEE